MTAELRQQLISEEILKREYLDYIEDEIFTFELLSILGTYYNITIDNYILTEE